MDQYLDEDAAGSGDAMNFHFRERESEHNGKFSWRILMRAQCRGTGYCVLPSANRVARADLLQSLCVRFACNQRVTLLFTFLWQIGQ